MKSLDKEALKKFAEVMGEDFQVILALAGEDLERKLVEFINWLILEIESTKRREPINRTEERKGWELIEKFEDPGWKDYISKAVPSKWHSNYKSAR